MRCVIVYAGISRTVHRQWADTGSERDEGSWCDWMSFAGIDKGSQTMESLIVLSKQIFREVAGRILGVASIGNHGHF